MERRRDKISRAHEDAFRSGLRVQVQAAIRAYRDGASVDLAIREAQGPILKAMGALYYEAFMSFARSTHDEILKRAQKNVDEATILTWEQLATRFVKEIGTRKITRINETTRGLIAAVIERGVADGSSVPNIVRDIRQTVGEINDKTRATRIVRTEVIGASNYGAIEGARATGLPIEKRWLATPGPRTRPTHTAADGQTRPLDGKFNVGHAVLDHPGDQTVNAPDETINCFPGDTVVSAHDIKRAFRSWYKGEMVTIETTAGEKLTGTPNHPVLTPDGWVTLGELHKGADVIQSPIQDPHVAVGAFDVQYVPTRIEQIFDTLSDAGGRMRMDGSRVNLYGDRKRSNVDVVDVLGFLRYRLEAMSDQELDQFGLTRSDLTARLFLSHRLPDARLFKELRWLLPDGLVRGCDQFVPALLPDSVHADLIGFGRASDSHPGAVQSLPNEIARHSKGFTDSQFGLTGLVGSHESRLVNFNPVSVASTCRSWHDGFVYTFETRPNVYNAQGLLVSNCRCAVTFEVLE